MVFWLDHGTISMLMESHLQPGQEVWTSSWNITVLSSQCDMDSAGSLLVSSTRVSISEKNFMLLCDSYIVE